MKPFINRVLYPVGFIFFAFCLCANGVLSQESSLKSASFAGQWPYHPSKAIGIDPQKNLIFLGDGNTVNVLDVNLNLISSFNVTQSSQIGGLFYSASENWLYIACRTEGLKVYDMTDSKNPLLVTSYLPEYETSAPDYGKPETVGVFIDGSKAYLSSGIDGMVILDITDRMNPSLLSQSKLFGAFYQLSYATDIYASGNFSFVADAINGLHIVDISDPKNPDYKRGIAIAGATDISVSNDYLYLATQGSGMVILDISTPENLAAISLFAADGVATSVRVDDDLAFISYDSVGIRILDITSKTEPFHDPTWLYDAPGASSLGLFQGSNFLFCANDQVGLQKIDITDKSNMQSLRTHDTPADAVAIDVSGNYIYAVDNTAGNRSETEGFRIHQISTANRSAVFAFTGFCPTPGKAQDVKVSGNYAYIADGDHGIQIIDITDKAAPEIIGNYDTSGTASGIFIDAGYAYVADGNEGMAIINIADKSNPVLTAAFGTGGNARKIYVSGGYAYVANGSDGIQIIDVSDKANPIIVGNHDTPGTANGIVIKGNYAYVADGSTGVVVIDITDKSDPSPVAAHNTDGSAENISVSGSYIYVADGPNGLVTIDISNPSQPATEPAWSYNSTGITTDVFGGYFTEDEEIYILIADGGAGVVAVNLSIEEVVDNEGGGGGGGCFIQTIKNFLSPG